MISDHPKADEILESLEIVGGWDEFLSSFPHVFEFAEKNTKILLSTHTKMKYFDFVSDLIVHL